MKKELLKIHIFALKRRKITFILMSSLVALGVFSVLVLQNLTAKQKAALDSYVTDSKIVAEVTTLTGKSNEIDISSAVIDKIVSNGNTCDIRAQSKVEGIVAPKDTQLRRIYSLDSNEITEKNEVAFFGEFDESVLSSDEQVCIISSSLEYLVKTEEDIKTLTFFRKNPLGDNLTPIPIKMRVAGTVEYNQNSIFVPFYTDLGKGDGVSFKMENCSFSIKDNNLLEETKEELYTYFSLPKVGVSADSGIAGLVVKDKVYKSTFNEMRSNWYLLRILLPVLVLMTCAVGFFANYISIRSKKKEIAVMRCMGLKAKEVFLTLFCEQFILALIGFAVGFICGTAVERGIRFVALLEALLILCAFLAGASVSAYKTANVSAMMLMKTEE